MWGLRVFTWRDMKGMLYRVLLLLVVFIIIIIIIIRYERDWLTSHPFLPVYSLTA